MKVDGKPARTIWIEDGEVRIIDQCRLPFEFSVVTLASLDDAARAIADMQVRGAGLIGATAGFGIYLAARDGPQEPAALAGALRDAGAALVATRPTAVNLKWAVERQLAAVTAAGATRQDIIDTTLATARSIADEDADWSRRIGEHGRRLIEDLSRLKGGDPVNVLTHCNAGWLAFIDLGTATAPLYAAHDAGLALHVWVDETRPRNQGSRLTAWELGQHGVPHTVIADNTGGHLMQRGMVDLVITGTDRTTRTGDVANKIGTYLKALAARDNGVPFYVALPSSTIDWECADGMTIPIEERGAEEVASIEGWHDGTLKTVRLIPEASPAANYAFDVTPARLVTGLITERGVCEASEAGILSLFPERG